MKPSPLQTVITTLTGLVAAASLAAGVWAMAAPRSFYTVIAAFPPYNQHLIHDIGAFQLALGTCLMLGLSAGDALLAVLTGNAVGADAHAVSHLMDQHLGGHASDPLTIGALGLLLTVLAVARWHLMQQSGSSLATQTTPQAPSR